ncbi:SO_0444 family Cu/Zn efflux transporter [Celerinatantimonas sp. MCCC 1A17872]|uniref:SO_0444 family Cu/Zn efflux transporter n=1 Tax=Celerinatantimonas sp. MCCC 1A17872 TaxID=3177514 RepID=UPI0038C9F158
MNTVIAISQAFIDLWLDAAVWLILGFIVAGLLQSFIRSDNLGRHLQGRGLWPAIKAAMLGTPLPLCSCGVIPAAMGLRRAGASKSATTAFLIATPETGVDSIAISYALLGPFMAIIRPIAAIFSAIVSATLVLVIGEKANNNAAHTHHEAEHTHEHSCSCSHDHDHHHHEVSPDTQSWLARLWGGQRYAFTELLEDLSIWLIVGLVISAVVVATVPSDTLASISQGPWAMLVMALIGVPMYICASASTPLAAGLMLAGVSPGAILVFLLAGPATNIATLGIVNKELGFRSLISYLSGVVVVAIGFGYLTNALVDAWQINIQSELASSNQLLPWPISAIAGIALALLVGFDLYHKLSSYYRRRHQSDKQSSCCHDSCCHH